MNVSYQTNHVSLAWRCCASLLAAMGSLVTVHAMAAEATVVKVPANCSGEEIQKALNELTEGGEVFLPPGRYEIHKPILLQFDRQTLRGSGESTILYLADNANCPVVILGAPLAPVKKTTTHLLLSDLFIDGNRKNQQVELWRAAADGSLLNNNGVNVCSVSDSTIERVECCRCRSGGIVTADARRLTVRDFAAFDNEFDGLACYLTVECLFEGLSLHDNQAAGISLDLAFNYNVIRRAVLTANDLGVFMRDSRDNLFQGLTVIASRHHGIFVAQTYAAMEGGWKLKPGTECVGNSFEELVVQNCGGDGFLVNDKSCENNIIRDAKFVNNTKGGLRHAWETGTN